MSSGLVDPSGRPLEFRKDKAPGTGRYGSWSGPHTPYQMLSLPGGGMIQFDLERLTLNDYRQMRNHYQVNASLTLLTFMMHQIDWRVECEDKRIADELTYQLEDVWTRLIRGVSQAYWAGYSPMVVEYENNVRRRRVEVDKIKDLIPEDSRVHWKEVEGYAPPGRMRSKHYLFDGIDQVGENHPIPVENSLWYPLLMENGNYYGRKVLKPSFPAYFFSILLHLFANRYFERFGEPLPIGRAPFDDEVEIAGEVMNGREAMEQVLMALRNRSVVVLPSDREQTTKEYEYQLEYLESQMRGADFERYMNRLDEEISLGMFTPVLLFRTADVGSYNLGVNHMQVWMWMLNALAGDLKEYLERYLLNRLKAINFSPNAPRAYWNYRKMGKEHVETIRAVVTELMRDGSIGVKDLEQLGQYIGLDLKEIQQVTEGDEPQRDERVGRPERPGAVRPRTERGRSITAARGVVDEIVERIDKQFKKAQRSGALTAKEFSPSLGYRRKFEEALIQDGVDSKYAHEQTEYIYAMVELWMKDTLGVPEAWKSSDFAAALKAVLIGELDGIKV